MATLILALIYLAFISLGLQDALLGSAWPSMQSGMDVPLSYAGLLTMIIAGGTIISSLLSDRLTKKLGAGLITAISVFLTAASLLGYSASGSFWALCAWAVPYGLSSGAIDAALNNYIALRFSSRYMNWLHCCWGLGAAISPYIMGYCLTSGLGWSGGYRTVSFIQIALAVILFASLPLWRKHKAASPAKQEQRPAMTLSQVLRIRGVKFVLAAFFGYCALESTAFMWASSFLVFHRGIEPEVAAKYASYFFIGVTAGRFLSGFISNKIGNHNMIRLGISILIAGIAMVWLPIATDWVCLSGLAVIGLGCAPVYPAIVHSTPANFGADKSQAVIGVQMASAYTGSALMPPVFGLLAGKFGLWLFPYFLLFFALTAIFLIERLIKTVSA